MASSSSRLSLGGQVHELKIGKSFREALGKSGSSSGSSSKKSSSSKSANNASGGYHTIRYDFKPASLDPGQMGALRVAEDGKGVAVDFPHADGNHVTNYAGHIKESNKKDCVLIIDPETGEITLERLSSQILVKKVRPERPEKSSSTLAGASSTATSSSSDVKGSLNPSNGLPSRPATPLDQLTRKSAKNSPASGSFSPNPSNQLKNSSRQSSRSNSPMPMMPNASGDGFSGISVNEMLPGKQLLTSNGHNKGHTNGQRSKEAGVSSRTLSDSSSSSSDSSSSDSDESDEENGITVTQKGKSKNGLGKSSSPSSGQHSKSSVTSKPFNKPSPSMPSDILLPSAPSTHSGPSAQSATMVNNVKKTPPPKSSSAALSMPQVLNDDLQLSESDDSDSSDMDDL